MDTGLIPTAYAATPKDYVEKVGAYAATPKDYVEEVGK